MENEKLIMENAQCSTSDFSAKTFYGMSYLMENENNVKS
jgi:hypothetical protein